MSRSEIESKIYGVADSFRRESEEAHRQKDLALERLRLSQEEVAVAKQSSATLKAKLEELKKESGTTATREIQQLKGEVADFTNQYTFQRKELDGLRNKLKENVDKQAPEDAKRSNAVRNLQAALVARREKTSKLFSVEPLMEPAVKFLQDEIQADIDGSLNSRWPRLVQAKAASIEAATSAFNGPIMEMERILVGYERQFSFVSAQVDEPPAEHRSPSKSPDHGDKADYSSDHAPTPSPGAKG